VAASHPQAAKPGDTAVVEALPVDDDEFEIEFDEDAPTAEAAIEAIPLAEADEAPAAAAPKKAAAPPAAEKAAAQPAGNKAEDDAVAQFLLDLNLDQE
jgi:hypothetical protein